MPSFNGAAVGGIALGTIFAVFFALAGMFAGGYLIWQNAPPVGGEWWFYIRIVVSVLGAFVGIKVGAIVGYFLGMIFGGMLGGVLG